MQKAKATDVYAIGLVGILAHRRMQQFKGNAGICMQQVKTIYLNDKVLIGKSASICMQQVKRGSSICMLQVNAAYLYDTVILGSLADLRMQQVKSANQCSKVVIG